MTPEKQIVPLEKQIVVDKMFYTRCNLCGAQNDWSDSRKEANKRRREHLAWHKKHGDHAENT
jgi:hypothetical protein